MDSNKNIMRGKDNWMAPTSQNSISEDKIPINQKLNKNKNFGNMYI